MTEAAEAVTKDWEYYALRPDEMPDDPAMLAALDAGETLEVEQSEEGDANTDGVNEEGEEPAAEQEAEPPKGEEAESPAGEATSEEPEAEPSVANKSGKPVIPYTVLKNTRQEAARLRAENEQLKRALQAPSAATDDEDDDVSADGDDLERFADDFPSAKPLIAKLKAQEQELRTLQEREAQAVQREREAQRNAYQEALDDNPTLSGWLAQAQDANGDPTFWNAAVQAEKLLAVDPQLGKLPLAERLERVVHIVEAGYGIAQTTTPKPPQAQPQQVTKAATPRGKPTPPVVPTLSDIPGGKPVGQEDLGRLEDMDQGELERLMLGMTPEQIDVFLARHA
jgi:hypothetical protein